MAVDTEFLCLMFCILIWVISFLLVCWFRIYFSGSFVWCYQCCCCSYYGLGGESLLLRVALLLCL